MMLNKISLSKMPQIPINNVTQHYNDTQHNDFQQDATQHNNKKALVDTTLSNLIPSQTPVSTTTAECRIFFKV
jgi:hypothetical protein